MPRSSPSSAAPGADREGTSLTLLAAGALAAVCLANLAPPARAWWPTLLAAAAAALACGVRRWPGDRFWWMLAGVALGGLAGAVAPRSPLAGPRAGVPVRASVAVRDGWQAGELGWTTRVAVRAVEHAGAPISCPREVWMTLPPAVDSRALPPPGTRWTVAGELAWQRGRPLQRPQLRVKSERLLQPAGAGGAVDRLRSAAMDALLRAAGADLDRVRAAGLAAALALGRTDAVPAGEVDAMRRGGLAHLLAVSGLNVGLVGASVWGMLAVAGVRPARRRFAVAASMLAFAALAGWGAPVRRAAFAGAAYLVARQLGRPLLSLPVVWAVVAGIALLEPDAVLQAGFQLSAVVTLALVRWVEPLAARLRPLPAPAAAAAAVALVGQSASAPLVGQRFGMVSWWGVGANLAAAPLAFVMTVVSLLAVAAAAVAPAAGGALLSVLLPFKAALDAIAWLAAGAVSEVPAAPPAAAGVLIALGVTGLGRARAAAAAAAGTVVLWLAWAALPEARRPAGGEVRMLPVTDGMALLLRGPGGAVLVDAGRSPTGAARALAAQREKRLAALVVTHPDVDHTGGAARVLERLPVGRLVYPAPVAGDPRVVVLRRLARTRGTAVLEVAAGQRVVLAGAAWDVVWPPARSRVVDNDASLVARVHLTGVRVLITGDIEQPGEQALVASRRELFAEVLQLPHHGSATSSWPAFLRAVEPRLALAASGTAPRYPYPAADTLRRVRALGATVMTQRHGATVATWATGDDGAVVDGAVSVRLARQGRVP